MIDKGYIQEEDKLKRRVGDETVKMVRLSDWYLNMIESGTAVTLTQKQKLVVNLLEDCSSASVKEVCYMTNCTPSLIKRMTDKNILAEYKYEVMRNAIGSVGEISDPESIKLNEEQKAGYDGIMSLINEEKPAGALLYGVTGSGKTAVFSGL